MLSKITLANTAVEDIVLHEDTNASRRNMITTKGLVGIGPLRSSIRVRPSAHGGINETRFEEGRSIELTGEVWSTVSIEEAFAEFRKVSQVLLESLDNGGALLKWTEGLTGLKLQQVVQLDSECEPTETEAAAYLNYSVTLYAEDPRAYSQTLTTQTGANITGVESENEWLAAATTTTQGIAIDSTHIYWAGKGCIGRAAIGGGSIEPEWIKGVFTPWALAVNGSNIYWANQLGIGKATIAGGTIEDGWRKTTELSPGTTGKEFQQGLAIDAGHIYWPTGGIFETGAIGRMTLAGGTIEKTWIPVAGTIFNNRRTPIVVDAGHVYWGLQGAIGRAAIGGTEVNPEWVKTGSGTNYPGGLAVSSTFVYWSVPAFNALYRATIAGGEVVPYITASGPEGVAVSATALYWNNVGTSTIGKWLFSGTGAVGSEVTVAQSGNRPTPLLIRIHGPCKNPSVVRTSDGSTLTLSGTIASGSYVEIDTSAKTAKLNGTANALSMVSAQATNWAAFIAPPNPKTSSFQLRATSATAAFMDVLTRAAYA